MSTSIRNVAIVAHVDHGKTSLVDCLFRTAGALQRSTETTDRLLDSNDLERERGITILSKNAAIEWAGVHINLIDTPGHADFGGQVERVLSMADGVLLVVDAFEGPMPQTRFVLQKAFESGLLPLVVVNKMDRKEARPDQVLGELFDLFVELGAEELALDFPVIYSSARNGWASTDEKVIGENMAPLLDQILATVPAPELDGDGPMQIQISTLDWDNYVGRIGIGRVRRGVLRQGQEVMRIANDGKRNRGRIKELYRFEGMERVAATEVRAGDIASIAGLDPLGLGDTLCHLDLVEQLPPITVEEPTIEMEFLANDSPFAGQEGKFVTSRQVAERLDRAGMMDPALRILPALSGGFLVAGRGVLHLGILIENMRREGYEFAVGKPRVLIKQVDGKDFEPEEDAQVEMPEDALGKVIEFFSRRSADISDMIRSGKRATLHMRIPTRGLLGARSQLLSLTRGEGVLSSRADGHRPWVGDLASRHNGVLVSSSTGRITGYALRSLEDRGEFFVQPGEMVYNGMVVGENNKEQDITLNATRERKLTNVRSANKDVMDNIRVARNMGLEAFLEYLDDDELLEVTPQNLRLRKRILDEKARQRATTKVGSR
ncbi:MAG: translational GTPase TypA [Planctomycetes bacterium]|nr:translational GTPase TypA [Planctomycetota bacterium]